MRRFLSGLFVLLLVSGSAFAALTFPALTGRVVDDAGILSDATKQNLEQMLAAHEAATTNQVVVVTLPSLQGTSIEDYGYQLGRHWGLGQKGKDNGVLLIVAPKEHKVRIEVGYGLEGTLTDAESSEIVHGIILPAFRTGQMEQGIMSGITAILSILQGKDIASLDQNTPAYANPIAHRHNNPGDAVGFLFFMILYFFMLFLRVFRHGSILYGPHGYIGTGYSGGFGGGGGFSGGGGGFGGGGCSGGW